MRKELKIYVPERLKNRIQLLAEEKGIKMNKLVCMLLEEAIYMLFEEEKEYGEIESKQIDSK